MDESKIYKWTLTRQSQELDEDVASTPARIRLSLLLSYKIKSTIRMNSVSKFILTSSTPLLDHTHRSSQQRSGSFGEALPEHPDSREDSGNVEWRPQASIALWSLGSSSTYLSQPIGPLPEPAPATDQIHTMNTGSMNSQSYRLMPADEAPKSMGIYRKIMYRLPSAQESKELLASTAIQEIMLPMEAIEELRLILEGSSIYLPASMRSFREWRVGLLEHCPRLP